MIKLITNRVTSNVLSFFAFMLVVGGTMLATRSIIEGGGAPWYISVGVVALGVFCGLLATHYAVLDSIYNLGDGPEDDEVRYALAYALEQRDAALAADPNDQIGAFNVGACAFYEEMTGETINVR